MKQFSDSLTCCRQDTFHSFQERAPYFRDHMNLSVVDVAAVLTEAVIAVTAVVIVNLSQKSSLTVAVAVGGPV